jgi:hypothetical protein
MLAGNRWGLSKNSPSSLKQNAVTFLFFCSVDFSSISVISSYFLGCVHFIREYVESSDIYWVFSKFILNWEGYVDYLYYTTIIVRERERGGYLERSSYECDIFQIVEMIIIPHTLVRCLGNNLTIIFVFLSCLMGWRHWNLYWALDSRFTVCFHGDNTPFDLIPGVLALILQEAGEKLQEKKVWQSRWSLVPPGLVITPLFIRSQDIMIMYLHAQDL